jgi:hypothetical protein
MPTSFRIELVVLMVANLVLVCLWEYFIVNGSIAAKLCSKKNKISVAREKSTSSQRATKHMDFIRDIMESDDANTSDQSESKHVDSEQIGMETA